MRVDGALYENGTTGTVLRDLTLLVEGDRQTLVIRRFTATDGGAGRLNGEGTIGLDGAAGYPLDVRVQAERARLVARDDATATMSGRIALAGNVAAPKLKGEISVDRADISIPSGSARAFRSCRWRRSAAGATAARLQTPPARQRSSRSAST